MGGQGSIDGVGPAARFFQPNGVTVDSVGNIYVADTGNNMIRKITSTGTVTTLAGTQGVYRNGSSDGVGTAASFYNPSSVAVDRAGNVYVNDYGNYTIRKITPEGKVVTLAGMPGAWGASDGTGAAARFGDCINNFGCSPPGIAVDSVGNIYAADPGNETIRKITPEGIVTTLAGSPGLPGSADGTGSAARFNRASGIAIDSADNIYVSDTNNYTIRKVTKTGVVTTLAGQAGQSGNVAGAGSAARFGRPAGLAADRAGNLYVIDGNQAVRKVTPDGNVTTLAGGATLPGSADGTGAAATFNYPTGVATDNAGNVYVADTVNNTIRKISQSGAVTTFAGLAGINTYRDGIGAAARFVFPAGVATDGLGNVYVADAQSNTIRKVTSDGVVSTFAGKADGSVGSHDGIGSAAMFSNPSGVATDSVGNVYVADTFSCKIRKITPLGSVTTLAGADMSGANDGVGAAAQFFHPTSVAVDGAGNVYVADGGNNTIRKITPGGIVTTLAGKASGLAGSADGFGEAARFYYPEGIAVDSTGNVFVADTFNNTVRKISAEGNVITFAGTAGAPGFADGVGAAARFFHPKGVSTDGAGNVYVADTYNHTIRKITPAGLTTTVVGVPGQSGYIGGALPGSLLFPGGIAIKGTSLYITTARGIVVVNNVP